MLKTLEKLDQELFLVINGHHSTIGDRIVYWITDEFVWLPFYTLLVYLIIINLKSKTLITLIAIAILIIVCDQFASGLVKPGIKRLRPCNDLHISHLVRVVGHYKGIYGFISSHAANTFGLAMFIWQVLRPYYRHSYMLFVWAAGISYARVYGGVHYPADVIMGALMGLGWAWLIYRQYARFIACKEG